MRNTFLLFTMIGIFGCQKNNETINPPVPPTTLTATAKSISQIDLAWTDNSTNEDGFKIERKTGTEAFNEIATVNKDITTYNDQGLTKFTAYTYRVYAFNNGGKSATYTNEATATTQNDIPSAATNLTADAVAFNRINLAWTDNATNETGYKIERKVGTGAYSELTMLPVNTAQYKDETVSENIEYTYRVYPINTSGNGSYSNEAKIKTPLDIITGLLAYYPFTGNAGDSSGNGNHGVVNGATLTTDRNGSSNAAYSFNGTSNYINIANAFFNNGMTNMTFSIWFYPTTDVTPGGGRTFINTLPHNGIGIGYNYASEKKIYVFKNSDPQIGGWDILQQNTSNFIPTLNTWYHITFVKSGLTYYYYVNGTLDKTVETSVTPINYNCSMRIGSTVFNSEFFQGKLDDIRFYNRVLTQEQINYLATH